MENVFLRISGCWFNKTRILEKGIFSYHGEVKIMEISGENLSIGFHSSHSTSCGHVLIFKQKMVDLKKETSPEIVFTIKSRESGVLVTRINSLKETRINISGMSPGEFNVYIKVQKILYAISHPGIEPKIHG